MNSCCHKCDILVYSIHILSKWLDGGYKMEAYTRGRGRWVNVLPDFTSRDVSFSIKAPRQQLRACGHHTLLPWTRGVMINSLNHRQIPMALDRIFCCRVCDVTTNRQTDKTLLICLSKNKNENVCCSVLLQSRVSGRLFIATNVKIVNLSEKEGRFQRPTTRLVH